MSKTKKIVVSGILIALSIVMTRLLAINPEPFIRISFGFVPVILAGIILGPFFGFAVGGVADILGCLLFGIPPFLPISLTSALAGLLSWLIYRLLTSRREWIKVLSAVVVTQIVCSLFLQTYWLTLIMPDATFAGLFFWRAIVALGMIPIYYILVHAILAGLRKAGFIKLHPSV